MRVQRLPREPGQVWRALGLAGVLICAVEAAVDLIAFQARQQSGSDDPATMIAILLLVQWLMPLTASAVLLGAVPGGARSPGAPDGRRRIMVWLMRAGAAASLAFGVSLKALEMRGAAGNPWMAWAGLFEWMILLLPLLFAALVWIGAAAILRPAAAYRGGFRLVLEGCGVAAVVPVAVAASESLPWTAGGETLARIGGELLWTAVPSLALMVVIGRTLRITRRSAEPASGI